jgi:hypothetical protein
LLLYLGEDNDNNNNVSKNKLGCDCVFRFFGNRKC